MPTLRDLLERRVPQYLAVYLGVGWGLIEFVSFLEERYALAAVWTDLLLMGWALFIPSVLLFTWYHGRPGRDRWVTAEKIVIPMNALIVLVVLGTAFTGRANASTTTVTLTDETGATVEHTVARSEFRKRLAIFDFDVSPSDTAIAWLAGGAAALLSSDLSQDIFLDMRVSAHFREKLLEAGIRPDQTVPVALQRRIAEDAHLPYFLSGSVSRSGADITLRTVLHETATGEVIGERSVTGQDVMALVDELTPLVKRDLGLPRTQPGVVKDLPVAELLSPSPDAVRALVAGQAALLRDDWAVGEQSIERATTLDPGFAFAHFALYQVRAFKGNVHGALPSLELAMQHIYRLPERFQFLVKAEHFISRGDMDRAYAVATMLTELYPDDLVGLQIRLSLERVRNDHDGQLATLRRMLELEPQQQENLLEIGRLQGVKGQYEDALRTYAGYARRFPQDHRALLRIASTETSLGRHADARASLDRALLLEPTNVEVLVELATHLRGTGEFDTASQKIADAGTLARTPQERARVHGAQMAQHEFRGQLLQALAAGRRRLAAMAEYRAPGSVAPHQMSLLGLQVRAGQQAEAQALLERVREQTQGQLIEVWRIGQLELALQTRDTLQLHEGMKGVRPIIDDYGLAALEAEVANGEAVLAEVRGDWDAALRAYQRQKQLEPATLTINRNIARSYRELGRLEDALKALEEHLRVTPFAPLSNLEAARLKLLRGDRDGAREHLARSARAWEQADPAYAPAAELRQLQAQLGG